MKYAIVLSQGMYYQGDRIRPERICQDFATASKLAWGWTKSYQRAMAPHGGSSGGYRVIEVDDSATVKNTVWFGHEIDLIPTAAGN
jgi:hypothetical protein